LRVDGGMTANAWFLQRLADTLGERVEVARYPETTALGAAFLAGQACGVYGSQDELQRAWVPSRAFEPSMIEGEREARYGGWRDALAKVKSRF
jgi:glycerol kinase